MSVTLAHPFRLSADGSIAILAAGSGSHALPGTAA